MTSLQETARGSGLAGCSMCHTVVEQDKTVCPQCGSRVRSRIPDSIKRTLALTVTATLLYIPANVLPITKTVYLGSLTDSTIMDGVVTLWQMGSYGIAAVILIASVLVPVVKLAIMFYLCAAASTPTIRNAHQCAKLYRLTELIGRWSMIDVFVVAILVALVKLGNLIAFYPGPGALAFAAVVIVTMIAAQQFDPRIVWDSCETDTDE